MSFTMENGFFQLGVIPSASHWSVVGRQKDAPRIEESRFRIIYRRGWRRFQALNNWTLFSVSEPQEVLSPYGVMSQRTITVGPDVNGLLISIQFALPQASPLLLWRISIDHQGDIPVFLDQIELLRVGFPAMRDRGAQGALQSHQNGRITLAPKQGELAFFSNGWGSWNYSAAYGDLDRFRRTRLGPFNRPMRVNAGTPQPGRMGHFASDMFGVLGDRTYRHGLLMGFLSQKYQFGSLEAAIAPPHPAIRMWANCDGVRLDPGKTITTDWACLMVLQLDSADPLGMYLDAVATEHNLGEPPFGGPPVSPFIPTGWCSWYRYFQDISEETIRSNLQTAGRLRKDLPLEVIQIDDGYQQQVGDWKPARRKFPAGMESLAKEIRAAGFAPGLWLAPFSVHPKSRLAFDHPDWLLRNRWGRPVNAGYVWNVFTRALDLTRPGVMDFVQTTVSTAVHEWGFRYLKLDFLYAAALPGKHHDPTRTRAQVLRAGLQAIREAAGADAILLGSGCPLGSAIGLVDGMRISADVAPDWKPRQYGTSLFFKKEPDLPAARNALHNAVTRAPFHRRWWVNDPDCLLLGPDTRLTLAEIHTMATVIAMSGGSVILSDDLAKVPAERLRIARVLLPVIGKRPIVLDWFDQLTPARLQLDLQGVVGLWHLVSLFNWSDCPKDLTFKLGDTFINPHRSYFARSFWDGTNYLVSGEALRFENVPAHGTVLLALRPAGSRPVYLGSDLHISQGLEVSSWEEKSDCLEFSLSRPGTVEGICTLFLPETPQHARVDGCPLDWHESGDQLFEFPINFHHQVIISIAW